MLVQECSGKDRGYVAKVQGFESEIMPVFGIR